MEPLLFYSPNFRLSYPGGVLFAVCTTARWFKGISNMQCPVKVLYCIVMFFLEFRWSCIPWNVWNGCSKERLCLTNKFQKRSLSKVDNGLQTHRNCIGAHIQVRIARAKYLVFPLFEFGFTTQPRQGHVQADRADPAARGPSLSAPRVPAEWIVNNY